MATTLGVPPFPQDADEANAALGATCGHFALAAVLGDSVMKTAKFFFDALVVKGRSWINLPMMHAALTSTGREWRSIGREWPQHGLVLIQFLGSWMNPGVPAAAACRHTHWVATAGGMVADVNAEDWLTRSAWEECVPQLFPRRATGWEVKRGIEVQLLNS